MGVSFAKAKLSNAYEVSFPMENFKVNAYEVSFTKVKL